MPETCPACKRPLRAVGTRRIKDGTPILACKCRVWRTDLGNWEKRETT